MPACRIGLATAILCTPAIADVHVVAGHGAGDFEDVQPAIDHALPGDVILLWPRGDFHRPYGDLQVTKGVTILGLSDEKRTPVGSIEVTGVPVGQTVVLANLTTASKTYPSPNTRVEGCEGTVLFQNCLLTDHETTQPLSVVDSNVALVDTELWAYYGGNGESRTGETNGANGVVVEHSHLAVWQSDLSGGGGEHVVVWQPSQGGKGGDGVRLVGASRLWLQDSELTGGWGSTLLSLPGTLAIGGDGGPALRAEPPALAYSRASYLRGGGGGEAETADGEPSLPVIGELARLDGSPQLATLAAWSRDDEAPLYRLEGPPHAAVSLVVSASAGWLPLGRHGVLVASPSARIPLGDVPANGVLETTLSLPDVGLDGAVTLFVQTVVEENGVTTVGVPRAIVAVDPPVVHVPPRIFVDPAAPAGGDGSSWDRAYPDLHTALERVPGFGPPSRTEIWLREGVYRPDVSFGDRDESFHVKRGTRLYGGFDGTETDVDERSARDHPTVLSGDLNGDDGPGNANVSDNSGTVVKSVGLAEANRDVLLDGLVLRDGQGRGYAWGSALESQGAIDLVDCTIIDNHGSATAWYPRTPEIRAHNCRFLGNTCNHRGGAVWVHHNGDAEFVNCQFVGNVGGDGTAIMAYSKTAVVNCTFYGNRTQTGKGSAIYVEYPCPQLIVASSVFWKGHADKGDHDDFHPITSPVLQVHRSLFEDGGTLGLGVGNVPGPPRFVDPNGADGVLGTGDDDFRLEPTSPCIDAGGNQWLPADALDLDRDGDHGEQLPVDLYGGPRRVDDPAVADTGEGTPPIVDMGAQERQ